MAIGLFNSCGGATQEYMVEYPLRRHEYQPFAAANVLLLMISHTHAVAGLSDGTTRGAYVLEAIVAGQMGRVSNLFLGLLVQR